jgi:hypothetical protein
MAHGDNNPNTVACTATNGNVTGTGGYYSNEYPPSAFDQNSGTYWAPDLYKGLAWIVYAFPSGTTKLVNKWQIYGLAAVQNPTLTLWGSNDNINWTSLQVVTSWTLPSYAWSSYKTFECVTRYQYFKITSASTGGYYSEIKLVDELGILVDLSSTIGFSSESTGMLNPLYVNANSPIALTTDAKQSFQSSSPPPPIISGGTESTTVIGGLTYKIHTCLTNTSLTVSRGGNIDYLIVGGGGGGGRNAGGGGGGGQFISGTIAVTVGSLPVMVGVGGISQQTNSWPGIRGGDSSLGEIVAGGGGGGGAQDSPPLYSGGSGGGGSGGTNTGCQPPGYKTHLLHFEGSDASTTFTDENGLSWTRYGNAQISTAQKKFGTSSGLFDGNGDYLNAVGTSLNFYGVDFSIDFWVRSTAVGQSADTVIFKKGTSNSYGGMLICQKSGTYDVRVYSSSNNTSWDIASNVIVGTLTQNQWSHIGIVRIGTNLYCYLNGNLGSTTAIATKSIYNSTNLWIGGDGGANSYFTGNIDELRIMPYLNNGPSPFASGLPTAPAAPNLITSGINIGATAPGISTHGCGGGGASTAGSVPNGGEGSSSSITGSAVIYGSGGGGGAYVQHSGSVGGSGGTGAGAGSSSSTVVGGNATGYGCGGGGSAGAGPSTFASAVSGSGHEGIVIVRYLAFNPIYSLAETSFDIEQNTDYSTGIGYIRARRDRLNMQGVSTQSGELSTGYLHARRDRLNMQGVSVQN